MSHAQVSRIERARLRRLSLADLVRVGTIVGLDLSVRAYPGGNPLRDAAHLALLGRLRSLLAPSLGWRTEVPLPLPGDQRAWDALISGAGRPIAVEAETRLRDVQGLARRIALKQRDGDVDRIVLLIADTKTNRSILRSEAPAFAPAFPVPPQEILAALRRGHDPNGSGIVLL